MRSRLLKSAVLGLTAAGIAAVAFSAAQAATVLPVQNLTFDIYSGTTPKANFSAVNPAGWYRGAVGGSGDLVYIDAPGTAQSSMNSTYGVYSLGDPPPGGNFVQADGNPDFESTFKQDIGGLVKGQQYTLSFWQAAGQDIGFSGATTEQWKVFLGDGNISLNPATPCGADSCYTVSAATLANNYMADSALMSTPSQGITDWEYVTVTLTAQFDGVNTLSFLAWGDSGSNNNLPPTVFLAGVNTPVSAPEPATIALVGAGIGGAFLRRRAKRKAQA